jgi:serine/threonine protein kinase
MQVFDNDEIYHIMYMLVTGLNHVHKNGIVHRDMKPENILIDVKNNTLKIIDFGLSKIDSPGSKGPNALVGTPFYMAPEIFAERGNQEAYKAPVDMWSLGILMFTLITGSPPFKPPNMPEKI